MNTRRFPALPEYSATWHAVRFEPMRASGERLTALIALHDAEGWEVKPILRDDVIRALFGSQAEHIIQMLEFVAEDLRCALEHGTPAEAWQAPLTGFSIEPARAARSHTGRNGAFRQAIILSAAFAKVDEPDAIEDERPAIESTKRWTTRIKEQIAANRVDLLPYFDQERRIFTDGSLIRFGFLKNDFAAHFEILRPANATTSARLARGKIYELKKAADTSAISDGLVIIGVHRGDDPTYGEKQKRNAEEQFAELRREAQSDKIHIEAASSAEQAAQLLCDFAG